MVRPSESHHIHLIGITERGIRLYFSTFPTRGGGALSSYFAGGSTGAKKAQEPSQLNLVYVRMPPPIVRETDVSKDENIRPVEKPLYTESYSKGLDPRVSFYSHGVFLMPHTSVSRNSIVAVTPHDATMAELQIDPTASSILATRQKQLMIGDAVVGEAAFLPRPTANFRFGLQESVSFLRHESIEDSKGGLVHDIAELPLYEDGAGSATPSIRSAGAGDRITKNIREHILNSDAVRVAAIKNGDGIMKAKNASSVVARKRDLTSMMSPSSARSLRGGNEALVLSPLAAQMCQVQRPHDILVCTLCSSAKRENINFYHSLSHSCHVTFSLTSTILTKTQTSTGTNEGVYRIHRFTAIEQMQQALSTCPVSLEPTASGGNNRLTDMFMMYGYDEACAMCLMIACTQDDVQLARNAAAYAGLRHDNSHRARTRRERQGADFPVELVAQASKAGMSPAERVRRCASDALIVFGGKCRISDRPNRSTMMMRRTNDLNGGRVSSFGVYETIHSYRYNGLVTYAARLLRPFWMHTIAIVPSSSAGSNNKFLRECRFNSDELVLLQEPIRRLCEFMESSHFASAVKMDPSALYVVVFERDVSHSFISLEHHQVQSQTTRQQGER